MGPKILGKATTEIFNGLVSKVSGGAGMNFEKIAQILLFALGLYVVSAALLFYFTRTDYDGSIAEDNVSSEKEISEKINRVPDELFDTNT